MFFFSTVGKRVRVTFQSQALSQDRTWKMSKHMLRPALRQTVQLLSQCRGGLWVAAAHVAMPVINILASEARNKPCWHGGAMRKVLISSPMNTLQTAADMDKLDTQCW